MFVRHHINLIERAGALIGGTCSMRDSLAHLAEVGEDGGAVSHRESNLLTVALFGHALTRSAYRAAADGSSAVLNAGVEWDEVRQR
jgi:hypothetical protein